MTFLANTLWTAGCAVGEHEVLAPTARRAARACVREGHGEPWTVFDADWDYEKWPDGPPLRQQ